MLKISLVTLGHLKYSLKVKELTEWKSNLLKITQNAQLNHLQDPEGMTCPLLPYHSLVGSPG